MYLRILSVCVALVLLRVSRAEDYPEFAVLPAPEQPNAAIDKPMEFAVRDTNVHTASNYLLEGVPQEKQALVRQKLREIDRLQAEIEEIRIQASAKQQILLQFLVFEVSLNELEKLDFHWPGLDGKIVPDRVAALQQEIERVHLDNGKSQRSLAEDRLGFLRCLAKEILAEPKLVVLNRRSATFNVEYEPEVAEPDGKGGFKTEKCGTAFDVTPTELSPNVVRLRLRVMNVEQQDPALSKLANLSKPLAHIRLIDTGIDAKYGQPFVLDGLIETKVVPEPVAGAASPPSRRMLVVAVLAERVAPPTIPNRK